MATSAYSQTDTYISSQLASCLANGLGSLCGSATSGGSLGIPDADDGKTSHSGSSCTNCEEGAAVVVRCTACSEVLCEVCAQAHQRVRLTKDHILMRVDDDSPLVRANSGSPANQVMTSTMDPNRADCLKFLAECNAALQAVKINLDAAQRILECLEGNARKVRSDVQQWTRRVVAALADRERQLLLQMEEAFSVRRDDVFMQRESLRALLLRFGRLSDSVRRTIVHGTSVDMVLMKEKATVELRQLRAARSNMIAIDDTEDFTVSFEYPERLIRYLASMGEIVFAGDSPSSALSLESPPHSMSPPRPVFARLAKAVESPTESPPRSTMAVESKPDSTLSGATVASSSSSRSSSESFDRSTAYLPDAMWLWVEQNTAFSKAHTSFGSEGSNPGELRRPWGICCDPMGRLIVADRSNNRIQIFTEAGEYLSQFGEFGTAPGQFNRPSGVTSDQTNRIIVADKDNHRIQVFDYHGKYCFLFGKFGNKPGQFNYPWDIATNAKGQIVVSDTRNRRLQLFTPDGQFLLKYGFENSAVMWKHFDNPRGVCFTSSGEVLVSDFNNHRILIVAEDFSGAHYMGLEGSGKEQFNRPQGVTVDKDGNFIVADSRNNRVQVFKSNGIYLGEFGRPILNMDRPSGICITSSGKIAVVDFGNTKIHLLTSGVYTEIELLP